MHLRHRFLIVFSLFLFALVPVVSFATDFLSIDINSDELVRIDSNTGTVTAIGAIGFNFTAAQLATLGADVYATNSPAGTLGTVTLVKINPVTGAMISSTTVKNGAVNLSTSTADGFTSDGTTLVISYSGSTTFPGFSYVLADLSTAGQVSNIATYSTSRDMDNLAALGTSLYAMDGVVTSPNYRVDLFSVARPSTYALIGSHFTTGADGHNGTVFDSMGNLWAFRRGARVLDRISTASGAVLQTVTLSTSRNMRGLTLAPETPVKTGSKTWGGVKALYR